MKGSMPDSLRPTLFDFVVYDALQFYTRWRAGRSRSSGCLCAAGDQPGLRLTEEFLAWKIESTDTLRHSKAIALYQRLMAFHQINRMTRPWPKPI